MAAKGTFKGGFDYTRLPGNVSWGSKAFYRKVATQDARAAMKDIITNYTNLLANIKDSTPAILRDALAPIFKRAQYYTPEDSGALWASGKLESGIGADGKPFASITFGDTEAWYAAIVHEYVWLNHQSPERSKFLQAAMEEGLPSLMDRLGVNYAGLLG